MDKIRFRTLVLDMDETMVSYVSPLLAVCRELFPDRQFKLPKYGRYNLWYKDSFPEQADLERLKSRVCTEEFYLSLPSTLSELHGQSMDKFSRMCWSHFDTIKVVTAREGWCPNAKEVSRECLRRHGFIDTDRLEVHAVSGQTNKMNFAQGRTLYVDDSITLADGVARSANHHMILINHPWNDGYPRSANITVSPVRRVHESVAYLMGSAEL